MVLARRDDQYTKFLATGILSSQIKLVSVEIEGRSNSKLDSPRWSKGNYANDLKRSKTIQERVHWSVQPLEHPQISSMPRHLLEPYPMIGPG